MKSSSPSVYLFVWVVYIASTCLIAFLQWFWHEKARVRYWSSCFVRFCFRPPENDMVWCLALSNSVLVWMCCISSAFMLYCYFCFGCIFFFFLTDKNKIKTNQKQSNKSKKKKKKQKKKQQPQQKTVVHAPKSMGILYRHSGVPGCGDFVACF